MDIIKDIQIEKIDEVLKRPGLMAEHLDGTINNVIQRIKTSGDDAIRELTQQFDKAVLGELKVSESEILNAENSVSEELKNALQQAKSNIEKFHFLQRRETLKVETSKGVTCWRKSVPIEKVGLYIPGGTAPLFSTVLMLGIPAQIAGCKEVVICSPPDQQGNIHPAILYTAKLVGISSIFKVGGAQAIAAMAYGTASIPKVDKIFGPGNQYVTKAKQMVNLEGIAIDMPAGPSEVAVIADKSADPDFIAADLLSQAEHGVDSQVILISTSEDLITKVNDSINEQLELLPRKEVAQKCLLNSKAILVNSMEEAIAVSNAYAPEHLIINCEEAMTVAEKITQAGSVFIGEFTPESAGDYASGTNHTLPTNGAARAYSGVSLDSFVKEITFQSISAKGIQGLGSTIEIMAEAEELIAHKNAVSIRLKKLSKA